MADDAMDPDESGSGADGERGATLDDPLSILSRMEAELSSIPPLGGHVEIEEWKTRVAEYIAFCIDKSVYDGK